MCAITCQLLRDIIIFVVMNTFYHAIDTNMQTRCASYIRYTLMQSRLIIINAFIITTATAQLCSGQMRILYIRAYCHFRNRLEMGVQSP